MAFINANWPAGKQTAGGFTDEYEQSGGYKLVGIETVSSNDVVEIVKALRSDDYFKYDLKVTQGSSVAIDGVSFTPVDRPANVAPPKRVPSNLIGPLVERELKVDGDFSGAVLIVANGRVAYERAEGLANRERGISDTMETRFRMASMARCSPR